MLRKTKQLKGLAIRASDGEIGTVDEFYFDDETWAIRYLIVETGGWLGGRAVLISPIAIVDVNWAEKRLNVALTKKQVEIRPPVDRHLPVSSHEAESDRSREGSTDSHLRSTQAVVGFHVEAADGEMGHVDDFVVDDEAWAIRYIEVATRNWWPGKKVLVSPAWIERVSWTNSKVHTALVRERIETAPQYDESEPITREYENRLYFHYGRPPYWPAEAAREERQARLEKAVVAR